MGAKISDQGMSLLLLLCVDDGHLVSRSCGTKPYW
jgi:hypothetical protein